MRKFVCACDPNDKPSLTHPTHCPTTDPKVHDLTARLEKNRTLIATLKASTVRLVDHTVTDEDGANGSLNPVSSSSVMSRTKRRKAKQEKRRLFQQLDEALGLLKDQQSAAADLRRALHLPEGAT